MHKKLGLGMQLASSVKNAELHSVNTLLTVWVTVLEGECLQAMGYCYQVTSFPHQFENAEKLMGLVSTVCACA